MSADDIDHISGSIVSLIVMRKPRTNNMPGTADLAMNNNNGLQDSPGPMNHGLDWPPQPQIFGAGVVATDITNIFSRAAASMSISNASRDSARRTLTPFTSAGSRRIGQR
jgi:hypothetical protein